MLFQDVLDQEQRDMAESAQRQRSSSFDFGAYHTLDDVSTSGEDYSDFFSWPFCVLSSIQHPVSGSKMSLQLFLARGFGFCSVHFVLRTISQPVSIKIP